MEWTLATSLALLCCLYLSFVTTPVSGKCRGKWQRHYCFGGNGKRSDPGFTRPPFETAASGLDMRQPSLLHKLLLSDMSRLSNKESDRSWSDSDDSYLPIVGDGQDGAVLASDARADDTGMRDNSDSAKLELAVEEVVALRKYTTALEHLLRSRRADRA